MQEIYNGDNSFKKRKKSNILWIQAKKKIHKNGSVKHIKCIHCGKTFSYVGTSTSNALNHLYRNHFNCFTSFMELLKKLQKIIQNVVSYDHLTKPVNRLTKVVNH